MDNLPYWQKQTTEKPLFPDIEWSKPEQKSQRGKLGIIGGNQLGLMAVSENYSFALQTGIGEARILLPDNLKSSIAHTITDVVYGKGNPSGGLSTDAINELSALGNWADGLLFVGDAGKNSETAILYEKFIEKYDKPITITRDAIDLIKNSLPMVVEKSNVLMIASFAQIQRIFQTLYYPKVLTFSMQLTNLIEALHKFTITYPVKIITFQHENLILAVDGKVTTTSNANAMDIWRGKTATNASIYWIWNKNKSLETITASFVSK